MSVNWEFGMVFVLCSYCYICRVLALFPRHRQERAFGLTLAKSYSWVFRLCSWHCLPDTTPKSWQSRSVCPYIGVSGAHVQLWQKLLVEIAWIAGEAYANASLGSTWSVTQEATRSCSFSLFFFFWVQIYWCENLSYINSVMCLLMPDAYSACFVVVAVD